MVSTSTVNPAVWTGSFSNRQVLCSDQRTIPSLYGTSSFCPYSLDVCFRLHWRSQASITFGEVHLGANSQLLKDLSLPWGGQRWKARMSLVGWIVFSPSKMSTGIFSTGHYSFTLSVAPHWASRCRTEGERGAGRAEGVPEHRDGTGGLQAPPCTALISSFWASCLYPALLSVSVQVKTLLLGSVQVKYSHCVKFGVGISTRLLSARCHVHSTSTAEARSSARYFSVPSKGPSPWADSQTRWANGIGTSWACSQTTFRALSYVERQVFLQGWLQQPKAAFWGEILSFWDAQVAVIN